MLFDHIYESEEVFEAKTATYSKMTYLTALLLCFRGPKGSKMSSKSAKNSKKRREERKKSRLAGWLVGWWVGWWFGCSLGVVGGWFGGGGSIRVTVVRHLGAPGGTIGGNQLPDNASHSLVAPHKGGLADLCIYVLIN